MKIFNKNTFYKKRFFLINFSVFVSLLFVIFKNIDQVRFAKVSNEKEKSIFLIDLPLKLVVKVMAEVIFLVIVAICIVALFAIEGNRAKELNKLENRIEFLQDRLLELATRADVQDALIKSKQMILKESFLR